MSSTSKLPKAVYGPFLKFLEYRAPTSDTGATWSGSILYVVKEEFSQSLTIACVLEYQGETQVIPGEWLDVYEDWTFYRFPIFLQLSTQEEKVTYILKVRLSVWDRKLSFLSGGRGGDSRSIMDFLCS